MRNRVCTTIGMPSCTALLAAALVPAMALAQGTPAAAADDTVLAEIIVTVRKRQERAIDVPASLNVFSGDSLEAAGVKSLDDLQYVTPGLKVASAGGGAWVSLRGVGNNILSAGPSVAVHIDGIYVPDASLAVKETFDIDRIEVLKGPEGTLYGRNATGGAINFVSKAPGTELGGEGYVGYGSNDLVTAQGGITVPLGDRGGVRYSGIYANDSGFTKNLNPVGGKVDDRDYLGFRMRARYALTESLTADVTLQYAKDRGTVGSAPSNNPASPVYASLPPQRQDPRRINLDAPPKNDQTSLLFSGTLTLDLDGIKLKSLTGVIDYKVNHLILDVDGSGGFIGVTDTSTHSRFFSQEFQLSGGEADGINWTSGLYYSRARLTATSMETDNNWPDANPYLYTDLAQRFPRRSAAVFGELSMPIGDRFAALLGGRYTEEKGSGTSTFAAPLFLPEPILTSAEAKSSAFTPKLLLEYRLAEGRRIYASMTRGYKSGGVNLLTQADTYNPERIWAYEVGTKNRLADGRAEWSLAGFFYDYTDLQLRTTLFTPTGIVTRVTNAAKASIRGVEASFAINATEALSIDFNGAYLDTELKNYISPVTQAAVFGLPMPLSPKVSYTLGARYRFSLGGAGRLTASVETTYQSKVNFPQFADLAREREGGYSLLNANLRYDMAGGHTYFSLIGRNLTNRLYKTQRFFYEGFSDLEIYGAPRTVEARIGYHF